MRMTNRKGTASLQNLKKCPFLVIILYMVQIQRTDVNTLLLSEQLPSSIYFKPSVKYLTVVLQKMSRDIIRSDPDSNLCGNHEDSPLERIGFDQSSPQ